MPFRINIDKYFGIRAISGNLGSISASEGGYRPELTGLRGLAIIIVVLGHMFERVWRLYGDSRTSPLQHQMFRIFATPFTGCCLFFCLSGYSLLITLNSSRSPFMAGGLRSYGLRRLLRLWPPYVILLTATYVVLATTNYDPPNTHNFHATPNSLVLSFFASLALSHDILFGTFPRLFPPGWFIENQFQFIVVGPVLWSLYNRLPFGTIRLAIGALLVFDFAMLAAFCHEEGPQNLQYTLIGFLPYFAAGAYVADIHLQVRYQEVDLKLCSIVGFCGLSMMIGIGMPFDNQLLQTSLRVICLLIVLAVSCRVGTSLHWFMANRWTERLGVMSYSIFLVHLQVLELLLPKVVTFSAGFGLLPVLIISIILGIGSVLVVAIPFFWLVERPWFAAALGK